MDRSEAVDELYAAALPDFVATRGRLVSAAKDAGAVDLATELAVMRKPTIAAWLLNQVARDESDVVAELTALGERMRSAQAKGDGAALAAARPERHERIEALTAAVQRAGAARGVTVGPAVIEAVRGTAVAVLADRDSGRALSSGWMLRPLTYAGFGEVELDEAVATSLTLVPPLPEDAAPPDPPPTTDRASRAAADERAREEELALACDTLRESERALSAAQLARSEAEHVLEAASRRVAGLEDEVAEAAAAVARLGTRPDV